VLVKPMLAADLPPVMIDLLQIEQVMINLLRNAIEAIIGSGNKRGLIVIEAKKANDEFVEVRVTDNGPGFPPSQLENTFLPLSSPCLHQGRRPRCRIAALPFDRRRAWRSDLAYFERRRRHHPLYSTYRKHDTAMTTIHIALIDDDEAVLDSLRLYFSDQNVDTT